MSDPQLVVCYECGQPWPQDDAHALRGLGWLAGLPRGISPSNADIFIHDGDHGDRFLVYECKRPGETLKPGQERALRALARQGFVVGLLRGTTDSMTWHRITSEGVEEPGRAVSPAQFKSWVSVWLNGREPAIPQRPFDHIDEQGYPRRSDGYLTQEGGDQVAAEAGY